MKTLQVPNVDFLDFGDMSGFSEYFASEATVQKGLEIAPQPAQIPFLECTADIAGFGGAAGGGKSTAQLIKAFQYIDTPGFGAVIFRRTNEDIRKEGALWDSARDIYAPTGARAREQFLDFTFPSGASISLNGLQYESDVYNYQGAQICLMGFDEASHFTGRQFWYMFSRNRSTCGVKPQIRLTFNPDPDSFIFELFGPWVDENHPLFPATPGEILWFIRKDNRIIWVDEGTENAKSISYFPATVWDNKILLEKDPGYLANLNALDELDRNRLLHGLWTAYEKEGALWNRAMFHRPGFRVPAVHPFRDEVTGRLKVKLPSNIIKVVVALDPSVSDPEKSKNPHKKPDECGVMVGGLTDAGGAIILADFTDVMSPAKWARLAVKLYDLYGAASIVAEGNQGGELIREVIQGISSNVPVQIVHASMGKRPRAEPVASLYENGRIQHAGELPKLESQMCNWDASNPNSKSPGRVDSLCWLVHALGLCQITGIRIHDRIRDRPSI